MRGRRRRPPVRVRECASLEGRRDLLRHTFQELQVEQERVKFVDLALADTPIHWARILWKTTRQHAQEEKGGSINHLSSFLINFYWSMGCVTAEERVQFSLLSRANPGRYVRDVEVDTDPDEMPASTPPARLRTEGEPRGALAPQKRKWNGEADLNQREVPTVPVRRRANNESARPQQKACKLILPADSNMDTRQAAVARNSPSSEEDVSAGVLGRSAELPALKSRVSSEQEPSGQTPSAQKLLEQVAAGEGRNGETRVPSAQAPSAVAVRAGVADPPGASSPTLLELLAGHGVEAAVEEAARPSARESPRISTATEILETEDDTSLEEEEVESVRGTPTGVLCEQMVPLLRYLDRKAIKYGDPCHRGSYVELVRNRTRIKVATNPEVMALDQKYRQLEERYNFLQDQCIIPRKLQKTAIQLRDELDCKWVYN
ncbi:hypothetical protein AXG93_2507s1000 [Marchantia polymorpha subsp. ruderalis]|uniref:Uncharacterized protein n=1 Tax=Marchantia polymorpha subsp. ruderalis TaxID=1480154 RepID=A0A176W5K3_MARPO|nr:hypothetical protein AXG93_2507s1000 [Marchantia polymorpha subsp. ruderalis]